MYELIGRAVTDVTFRKKLLTDPRGTARDAGYTLTDQQLSALTSKDSDSLATVLEERFPKTIGLAA